METPEPGSPVRASSPVLLSERRALPTVLPENSDATQLLVSRSHLKRGGCLTTPQGKFRRTSQTFEHLRDKSPASKTKCIREANDELIRQLAQGSAVKQRLEMELVEERNEKDRAVKKLDKTRRVLMRASMNANMLTSRMPGFQCEQLTQKDQQIGRLEWEVQQLKAQLAAADDSLAAMSSAPQSQSPGHSDTAQLTSILQCQMNTEHPDKQELRKAYEELLELVTCYRKRYESMEAKQTLIRMEAERSSLRIKEQHDRIEELETELAAATNDSWSQAEQVQQLVDAIKEAHATIGKQAGQITEYKQDIERLEASLEDAEACLMHEQQKVADLERKL